MRRYIRGALALGLMGSLTGCLDLDVVNQNNPERERALSTPADVESVIMSSFRIWYDVLHGLADVAGVFPVVADEQTNTVVQRGVQWSAEPRVAFKNDQLAAEIWIPRRSYDGFSECTANANDGLTQIKNGMKILTATGAETVQDHTDRAYSWAKMWQGICLGYLALTLDRFAVATEDTVLPQDADALREWERSKLLEENWQQGFEVAIRSLEQAIERMETGAAWTLPDGWVPGQNYTSQQMKQFAHTMVARLLVYSARTPQQRAAVDWDKVLYHTERGLTYDWGPVLAAGVITDPSYLARLGNTGTAGQRADAHLIGPADQSGAYQAYLKTPIDERDRFRVVTPDRRITGTTSTSNGAYFRYLTSSGIDAARNQAPAHSSYYQWNRRNNYGGFVSNTGFFALASADENRLLRAEAMLRKGRTAEAVALINVTRTRPVKVGTNANVANLPPVTVAGVPTVNGACVPRKLKDPEGRCGDLWDALMYERQIELTGQNPMRAWHDKRGFGQLGSGVWLHLPVPARYLTGLNIPVYTFGGVGGNMSAP